MQPTAPESILSWLRNAGVRDLLERLATGSIPLSHEELDKEPNSQRVKHKRSLLTHHKLLPQRDHYLALFQRWLTSRLEDIDDSESRRPLESFARWHHRAASGSSTTSNQPAVPFRAPRRKSPKPSKFLTWRKLATGGPSTPAFKATSTIPRGVGSATSGC